MPARSRHEMPDYFRDALNTRGLMDRTYHVRHTSRMITSARFGHRAKLEATR